MTSTVVTEEEQRRQGESDQRDDNTDHYNYGRR